MILPLMEENPNWNKNILTAVWVLYARATTPANCRSIHPKQWIGGNSFYLPRLIIGGFFVLTTVLFLIILVGYCSGKHRVTWVRIGHMKLLVLVMTVGVLVGCGKKDSVKPNTPNPKASQPTTPNSYTANTNTTKPEPAKSKVIVGGKLWEFETGDP